MVSDSVQGSVITVLDAVSLEVADNLAVGCLDPANLPGIARNLQPAGVDVIVLSACVQMPSLPAVHQVEDELSVPVITAAIGVAHEILKSLGHRPAIGGAGSLRADTVTSLTPSYL